MLDVLAGPKASRSFLGGQDVLDTLMSAVRLGICIGYLKPLMATSQVVPAFSPAAITHARIPVASYHGNVGLDSAGLSQSAGSKPV